LASHERWRQGVAKGLRLCRPQRQCISGEEQTAEQPGPKIEIFHL
jgi:hypothetical protein